MARAHYVKAARKAIPDAGIKVGEPYYWWKFRYGGKRVSKTAPKRAQLTQSEFYGAIYSLEDDVIANAPANDSLPGVRDDVVQQLEDMKSEIEDKLQNMPDSLQEGPTGQLLQERVDALDNAISEFGSLELDEPEAFSEDLDEFRDEREEGEEDGEWRMRTEPEAVDAYWAGKLEEFQGISIDAP